MVNRANLQVVKFAGDGLVVCRMLYVASCEVVRLEVAGARILPDAN